ncbi:BMP family ABC transporter substrate-binding protein [Sinomonas sp. JGH33]|uniref:BMP family ABC transporter substrate-binding protein n=1 Tax=Sinomonas terricola TaxID=3110330 RepID=A0ABU5T6L4_9MICC|nr:BMP family ABC transporter substrate-binding protein [Sinomonas sp. JGH33]MEA5455157.1 BMP family ABC transporter substrate-binding protein [Sinomonas sp. JGH33]
MKLKTQAGFAALAAASLLLTACGGTSGAQSAASDGSKRPSVANVIPGALGDQGFFDDAAGGIKKIESAGSKTQNVQSDASNPAQWKTNLESVSTGKWDVVVTGTSQMHDILDQTAQKYSKQHFITYDDVVKEPNVASIVYKQNEGSYLAGVLAALATTNKDKFPKATGSKVVGIVGGMDIPVINDFVVGFKKGVETVDPSIQVKVSYVGDFKDSNKGFDQAKLMYSQGADVVFQVAGGAGIGVLKAAAAAGRYAIGVDSNQNAIQPGFVLASMLKHVGDSLDSAVSDSAAGKLKYGETTSYGLANKGVGLEFANNSSAVPQDIQAKIESFAQQVVDGKVQVPSATS